MKSRSTFDVARTLLETYIGADAGRHVLTGEIDRHSVKRIRAVIWFCDLRGFSSVANRVPQEELVEILDAYLEAMARPVLDHQGQILKFMGDGFLATFDLAARDSEAVCADALEAAAQLLDFFPPFNAERRAAGKRTLDFGVALHLGEVLYGNIGASRAPRLHGGGIGRERGEPHRGDVPAAAAQAAGVGELPRGGGGRREPDDLARLPRASRHPRAAGALHARGRLVRASAGDAGAPGPSQAVQRAVFAC